MALTQFKEAEFFSAFDRLSEEQKSLNFNDDPDFRLNGANYLMLKGRREEALHIYENMGPSLSENGFIVDAIWKRAHIYLRRESM